MFDTRKEQEQAELHRAIWGIANSLRGSVDGWDFKQHVLGILFYRYISENITAFINAGGNWPAFDYARLSDGEAESFRKSIVKAKGFFILPSELFENVRAAPGCELSGALEKVFKNIEASPKGIIKACALEGLFSGIDLKSNKLGGTLDKRNGLLLKLLNGVGEMRLGNYKDNTIDAFGDAYEFLMGMYAVNAGKSGGEYYTPQEVSELLVRFVAVGKTKVNKVYDPACGAGSLLLKFAKILGKENVQQGFFGQDINITAYNLCRINMLLHDISYDKFHIAHGDTLTNPLHGNGGPFDAIVSNPPYSIKWDGAANPALVSDPRFSPAGALAPKSKADLAFIMHSLSCLANSGSAAIVCFPGVLYRNGAEQKIRKYLVDNNFIECVAQLPANLFYGTSVATCIIALKKSKPSNNTLFIDASQEFVKFSNRNKLSADNINRILEAYKLGAGEEYFARLVPNGLIAGQDYNLSVANYVPQKDKSEVVDIKALNAEIADIVARGNELRREVDAVIAEIEGGSNFE
ncbi:MAG: type I restriction-modification system subunit M [Clostridiales bacterium]|jgi:type I restriction enzyme M protein|nr:type I restriction-modification system subunit M [Clostridiales bacterium]